jgi:hypothetical protein
MRTTSGTALADGMHKRLCAVSDEYLGAFKSAAAANAATQELAKNIDLFKRDTSKANSFVFLEADAKKTASQRQATAAMVMRQLVKGTLGQKVGLQKAGVTTTLGYNYYDLRGPALLEYPVNTPFRNQIPRTPQVNAGTGTAAHWKATRNVGSQYAGVPEGLRAQVAVPDENDYLATYKALGVERNVSFEAEWSGEGFTGNLADEHLRGLHEFWLQEEGILLLGNSGTATGGNGFQLGIAPAPVLTASTAASTIASGTSITAYVVLLTAMGNPSNAQYGYQAAPSLTNGLVPNFSYNAPGTGTTVNLNGGMSAISPASNTLVTSGGNPSALATVSGYPNGVFGYAWFVSTNAAPTTANARLAAITQFPTYTISAAPAGTQTANAVGLNVDNSAQAYDFDGLLTWAARYGYWTDLKGAKLTSVAGGQCEEVETALTYFFTNFQAGVEAIWGSPDAIKSLEDTILANGNQPTGYQYIAMQDQQNNVVGGIIVSGYRSRYAVDSPTGANIIPMKIHPMIPPGTLYFDISKNPYPHSRIPETRAVFIQRDYYGIEWPAITRQWAFGTYANEVLAHYAPWLTGVITGIGMS